MIGGLRALARTTCIIVGSAGTGGHALAAVPAAAPGVDGDSRLQALVVRHPNGPQDAEELAAAFARLGTPALPDLFELQLSPGFEAFLPDEVDPSTWVVAPDDVPGVALRALALLPPSAVLAHVRERLTAGADQELLLASMRAIGAVGSAEGVPMLLDIVEGLGTDWGFPHVRGTVSSSLHGLFRDPASAAAFARDWERLAPPTREHVVEAMLAAKRPETAEFLLARLGEEPALDLRILSTVAEPLQRAPWRVGTLDLGGLAGALASPEPSVRAQAAVVFGKLDREDGMDELVARAGDPDPRVQRAVRGVLRDWSGNASASTPAEWSAWAAEELRWHTESFPGLLGAIDAGAPPEVVMAAAGELGRRPIHRRDAVERLAALLPRAEPDLGRAIARTLVELDGREAIPALIEALESSAPELAFECWKSLRALTGADLESDAAAWRAWLAR